MTVEIVRREGVKQAAFFDLEKTLTPHATEQELALLFARAGALSWFGLARVLGVYARYNLGLLKNFDELKRHGAKLFGGRPSEPDRARVRELFDKRLGAFIYPSALKAVRRCQELDFEVAIVSSTYRFMVVPYAQKLGIADVHGVDLEVVDGRWTGNITGTIFHQEHKAGVVRAAEARGISLQDSYAFGDSMNDVPMLAAVGHPVAVNPGKKLEALCRERGWASVRWSMSDR
jgi:HAD superfamily hydrolase (TIGR01490 family)